MSLHEIEDAVENAVRLIADSETPNKRSLFRALYRFERHNDCGFTLGRVLPELKAHRYVYEIDANTHPDIDRLRAQLNEGWLLELDDHDEHQPCFCENGTLLVEAGPLRGSG